MTFTDVKWKLSVITAQKHCEYTLSSLGLIFECVSVLCYFDEQVVVAVLQVIQEHERAIVFRLGRAIEGRAKGPGTRHSSLSSDL